MRYFDRQQGTLVLDGKAGHRVVSLSSAAIRFFEVQINSKIANASVFSTECGQCWNKDSWKKSIKQAVKAAKLTVVMYSLRRTAIGEMIASGIGSFEVAKTAGTSTEMIDKRGSTHPGALEHRKPVVLGTRCVMGEDASLIRDKVAAQNMPSLRKLTLNLPRLEHSRQPKKISLKNIRNLAASDTALRDSVLGLA